MIIKRSAFDQLVWTQWSTLSGGERIKKLTQGTTDATESISQSAWSQQKWPGLEYSSQFLSTRRTLLIVDFAKSTKANVSCSIMKSIQLLIATPKIRMQVWIHRATTPTPIWRMFHQSDLMFMDRATFLWATMDRLASQKSTEIEAETIIIVEVLNLAMTNLSLMLR